MDSPVSDPPIASKTESPPRIAGRPAASPPVAPAGRAPHPLRVVALYVLAIFFFGALIAPRFYASAQYLAEGNRSWRWLAEQPFHRYVDRCVLLLAIVGLPTFLKALRIPSARFLGLRFGVRHWAEALQGAAWGFAILGTAIALATTFNARTWDLDHSSADWLRHLRKTTLTALIVAAIEELLFRGALFGSLRRRYSFWGAAILSSIVYSIGHFFQRPPRPEEVEWYTGFITVAQMLRGFTDIQTLIPGFFNLALIGLILAYARERTGSLLFAFGLHASLVFWVKSVGFLTNERDGANTWAWGGSKLVDGWASGFLLLVAFFIIRATLPPPKEQHE